MQSDFLDRKLYKMAEQEQMAVSEDLDARVDDILQHLEKNGRGSRHHYSFRRAAILAAACLVLASATVAASGMYQARMENMNHEKLEEYFCPVAGGKCLCGYLQQTNDRERDGETGGT